MYDSLNSKVLDDDHINYLNKIYPFNKEYQFHSVQQQPNLTSCGAFAIYFATLLCHGQNPDIDILKKNIRCRSYEKSYLSYVKSKKNC